MRYICLIFFVVNGFCFKSMGQRADSSSHKFNYKFYPLSYILSQTPYCSDIQFAIEYQPCPKHGIQITASGSIPKVSYMLGAILFPYRSQFWLMYGGRGGVSYRYYIANKKVPGLYVGLEAFVAGYVAPRSIDHDYSQYEAYASNWTSPIYTLHGIMTNYNFISGFKFYTGKVVVDVGLSLGGRYHYFWRNYAKGRLELSKQSGLYKYYKLSPVGGSFNFAVGGVF